MPRRALSLSVEKRTSVLRKKLNSELPFFNNHPSEWSKIKHPRLKILSSETNETSFVVKIPTIDQAVFQGPKGFDFSDNETKIFIDEQRIRYCMEFVNSFNEGEDPYGVLFSGPNGVGKSSICLLTFLLCFTRSIPVAYIPMSQQWVGFSKTEVKAREYFMKTFFKQNADIIVNDTALLPHFKSFNTNPNGKFDPKSYVNFCQDVGKGLVRKCGFIAEEIQTLTTEASTDPSKRFFAKDFTIWTNFSGKLNSQLCASEYGLREFSLPSGEEDRIKFILPFPRSSVKSLLNDDISPFYMNNATGDLLDAIVEYFEGMPRSLWRLAEKMKSSNDNKESLEIFEEFKSEAEFNLMEICYKRFLTKTKDKQTALDIIMNILLRKEYFRQRRSKELYDYGLVYRCPTTNLVLPVNRCAEITLHEVYISDVFELDKKLSYIKEGDQRGHLFEDYLNAAIASNRKPYPLSALPYRRLEKDPPTQKVFMSADQTFYFDSKITNEIPSDISIKNYRSQWICTNPKYVCDGILLPSQTQIESNPIIIYDSSVTNPYERSLDKLNNLVIFRTNLKKSFPDKKIIIVLCYDGDIDKIVSREIVYSDFFILDKKELKSLKIPF